MYMLELNWMSVYILLSRPKVIFFFTGVAILLAMKSEWCLLISGSKGQAYTGRHGKWFPCLLADMENGLHVWSDFP